MVKLFSLEEVSSSGSDLLIDKLLNKGTGDDSPLSLTAKVLKQRKQVDEEIKEELEREEEDTPPPTEEDPPKEEETPKEEVKEESDEESDEGETPDEDTEDEDSVAEDEDKLKELIGTGNKSSSKTPSKGDDEKKISSESRHTGISLNNVTHPLRTAQSKYLLALEEYGLDKEATPLDQQPVTYIKEEVVTVLNNLISLSNKYITGSRSFIEKTTESVLKMTESYSVYAGVVENRNYNFTHKLVDDKDIIGAVSYKDHSTPRETLKAMLTYLEKSSTAMSLLLNNSFEEMVSSFTENNFVEDGSDLTYSGSIPGFNLVKVAILPWSTYLKVKIGDYHYYKLKAVKTEDLYNLSSISITEDKELDFIVDRCNDIITKTSISVDMLSKIVVNFNNFVDELKVVVYNIEKDTYTNLGELSIDDKLKDLIRFKLVTEASVININLAMEYLTSISSVLGVCVELKD